MQLQEATLERDRLSLELTQKEERSKHEITMAKERA
jgi:hypothetical protein